LRVRSGSSTKLQLLESIVFGSVLDIIHIPVVSSFQAIMEFFDLPIDRLIRT